jgi:transcriptional regulator with XRE-family HTH domain
MRKSSQTNQNALARARKKKGWSQEYLAHKVDVTVDAVRGWERGLHIPYQGTIQKLCELFDVPPSELGFFNDDVHSAVNEDISVGLRNNGKQAASNGTQKSRLHSPGEAEKKAAWELHVELVTRISVTTFDRQEGILREALSSLYSLFQTTRAILRFYGPAIAPTSIDKDASASYVVVRMLNIVIRPLLAKWHPLLKDYEEVRPLAVGSRQYEQQWQHYHELRQELRAIHETLLEYARTFAQIAEIPSLLTDTSEMVLYESSDRILFTEQGLKEPMKTHANQETLTT